MFLENKRLLALLWALVTATAVADGPPACVSVGATSTHGASAFRELQEALTLNHALYYYTLGKSPAYAKVARPYLDAGTGLILGLKLNTEDPTSSLLSAVLAGKYDEEIRSLARDIAKDGRTITIRPMYEANGDWYPWQAYHKTNVATEYVPAWKHLVQIFRSVNAPVKFDLNLSRNSAGNRKQSDFASLYPGDDFVDVVSVSSYNRCGSSPKHVQWKPFREEFDPAYQAIVAMTDRPIAVAETSTTSLCGGDKAAWITEFFGDIATKFPRVVNVTFFLDTVEVGKASNTVPLHWELENDAQVSAFKQGALRLRQARGACAKHTAAGLVVPQETLAVRDTPLLGDVRYPWSTMIEGTHYLHETDNNALNLVTGENFGRAFNTLRWQFKQKALIDLWSGTFGPWMAYSGVQSTNQNRWWENYHGLSAGMEYCSAKPGFVAWGGLCGRFGYEHNIYTAPVPDRLSDGEDKVYFRLLWNAGGEW